MYPSPNFWGRRENEISFINTVAAWIAKRFVSLPGRVGTTEWIQGCSANSRRAGAQIRPRVSTTKRHHSGSANRVWFAGLGWHYTVLGARVVPTSPRSRPLSADPPNNFLANLVAFTDILDFAVVRNSLHNFPPHEHNDKVALDRNPTLEGVSECRSHEVNVLAKVGTTEPWSSCSANVLDYVAWPPCPSDHEEAQVGTTRRFGTCSANLTEISGGPTAEAGLHRSSNCRLGGPGRPRSPAGAHCT